LTPIALELRHSSKKKSGAPKMEEMCLILGGNANREEGHSSPRDPRRLPYRSETKMYQLIFEHSLTRKEDV